jgi:hypothetical protein
MYIGHHGTEYSVDASHADAVTPDSSREPVVGANPSIDSLNKSLIQKGGGTRSCIQI